MAFYDDLVAAGNVTGIHTFDASLINPTLLAGATISNVRVHPDGELVDVTADGGFSLPNVLIHRNGRVGDRDLALDTIVLTVTQLASLSTPRQNYCIQFEQLPLTHNLTQPGRRPGVTRPARG